MTRALGQHQYGAAVIHEPSEIYNACLKTEKLNIHALVLYTDGIIRVANDYGVDLDSEANVFADLLKRGVRIDTPMAMHLGSFAKRQGLEDNATALSLDLLALNPADQLLRNPCL
jgi:hypothetical protein